ncbi:MAG: hypothetical protein K6F99_08225 [Lachnospiraceae bacterium]|nr:hypothetical protein [Lachnospiraceae bacterium]
MDKENKKLNADDLEGVSGGSGWYMTVNIPNKYLTLRPQPYYDQYHELAQLYPGYQLFTYGEITNGTDAQGNKCVYRKVCYNGIWGWVDARYIY